MVCTGCTFSTSLCVVDGRGCISLAQRMPSVMFGFRGALRCTRLRSVQGRCPKGLGIAPDVVDFERRVVIERKGSSQARVAVSRQALFYAAFMTGATGKLWRAEVQVYGSRHRTIYDLTDDVLDQLIRDAQDSRELAAAPAPAAKRIRLCDGCSCNELCWDEE